MLSILAHGYLERLTRHRRSATSGHALDACFFADLCVLVVQLRPAVRYFGNAQFESDRAFWSLSVAIVAS